MPLSKFNIYKSEETQVMELPEKKGTVISILGYGYVGHAMAEMFRKHYEVRIWTPSFGNSVKILNGSEERMEGATGNSRQYMQDTINGADLAIISAPTPMDGKDFVEVDGMKVYRCDTSMVEENVAWLETPVILIKSTVEVGTTDRLKKKYGKRIVFSPEYVGETKYFVTDRMRFHTEAVRTPFFICGGDDKDNGYIFDILTPVMGPECHYKGMPAKDAEFVKYMENDYFAHKVIWANEKRSMADALGVNWHNAREGWGLDPRVDKMHTAVFPSSRGFSGKCLPKDMNALTYASIKAGYTPVMELGMLKSNLKYRGVDDNLKV